MGSNNPELPITNNPATPVSPRTGSNRSFYSNAFHLTSTTSPNPGLGRSFLSTQYNFETGMHILKNFFKLIDDYYCGKLVGIKLYIIYITKLFLFRLFIEQNVVKYRIVFFKPDYL